MIENGLPAPGPSGDHLRSRRAGSEISYGPRSSFAALRRKAGPPWKIGVIGGGYAGLAEDSRGMGIRDAGLHWKSRKLGIRDAGLPVESRKLGIRDAGLPEASRKLEILFASLPIFSRCRGTSFVDPPWAQRGTEIPHAALITATSGFGCAIAGLQRGPATAQHPFSRCHERIQRQATAPPRRCRRSRFAGGPEGSQPSAVRETGRVQRG